jgi:hypothetical protein
MFNPNSNHLEIANITRVERRLPVSQHWIIMTRRFWEYIYIRRYFK